MLTVFVNKHIIRIVDSISFVGYLVWSRNA